MTRPKRNFTYPLTYIDTEDDGTGTLIKLIMNKVLVFLSDEMIIVRGVWSSARLLNT